MRRHTVTRQPTVCTGGMPAPAPFCRSIDGRDDKSAIVHDLVLRPATAAIEEIRYGAVCARLQRRDQRTPRIVGFTCGISVWSRLSISPRVRIRCNVFSQPLFDRRICGAPALVTQAAPPRAMVLPCPARRYSAKRHCTDRTLDPHSRVNVTDNGANQHKGKKRVQQ